MSRDIDAVDSVMAPEMVEMLARKEALQKEITQFRKDCDHTSAIRIPNCNVGNYDPSSDAYWYDCRCPRCGHIWREPQ